MPVWGALLGALAFLGGGADARALALSPNSLRIEDRENGTLVVGSERAELQAGDGYHTVLFVWGRLDVFGETDELVMLSGKVVFHPGSRVKKSLVVVGGEFEAKPGADVAGEKVVFKAASPFWSLLRTAGTLWREYYAGIVRWVGAIFLCVATWLFGMLAFAMFPGLQKITADKLGKEWGKNLFAGLLASVFVPAVLALLVISVIGIVAIPFYFLFLLAGGALAYAAAGLWAGHRMLPPKKGRRLNPLGFFLGVAAMQFFWSVTIPGAGFVAFALWLLGWGAVVRSLKGLWS